MKLHPYVHRSLVPDLSGWLVRLWLMGIRWCGQNKNYYIYPSLFCFIVLIISNFMQKANSSFLMFHVEQSLCSSQPNFPAFLWSLQWTAFVPPVQEYDRSYPFKALIIACDVLDENRGSCQCFFLRWCAVLYVYIRS